MSANECADFIQSLLSQGKSVGEIRRIVIEKIRRKELPPTCLRYLSIDNLRKTSSKNTIREKIKITREEVRNATVFSNLVADYTLAELIYFSVKKKHRNASEIMYNLLEPIFFSEDISVDEKRSLFIPVNKDTKKYVFENFGKLLEKLGDKRKEICSYLSETFNMLTKSFPVKMGVVEIVLPEKIAECIGGSK